MIVLGDVSGIQSYVFDVNEAGGGQARRVRARSFLVQAMIECAALRVLNEMNWPTTPEHFLFSGAGKFILRGSGNSERISGIAQQLNAELLLESAGELRLSLAFGADGNEVEEYQQARRSLQQVKSSPWRPAAQWDSSRLILPALDTPCQLCRRFPSVTEETDLETNEKRRVCRQCVQNHELGRVLPLARFLTLRYGTGGHFSWFGIAGDLSANPPKSPADGFVALLTLDGGDAPQPGFSSDQIVSRRMMSSIPRDAHGGPMWFTEIAKQAKGDPLLAVLKADVDSLGKHLEKRLAGRTDLSEYLSFADSLDEFFTSTTRDEIERDARWRSIYTVFAGGDDLVMIGPWDVIFRFAGHLRGLFIRRFPELSLSAGMAMFKAKRPVKTAIEQAAHFLEQAKHEPKDQFAAFGQVWSWARHSEILRQAEQLAGWTESNQIQRGWLHTLLELVLARHGEKPDLLATSRLAYHVSRNYRKGTAARDWAEDLLLNFDEPHHASVRYLPAIVRHALTATRTAQDKE